MVDDKVNDKVRVSMEAWLMKVRKELGVDVVCSFLVCDRGIIFKSMLNAHGLEISEGSAEIQEEPDVLFNYGGRVKESSELRSYVG